MRGKGKAMFIFSFSPIYINKLMGGKLKLKEWSSQEESGGNIRLPLILFRAGSL